MSYQSLDNIYNIAIPHQQKQRKQRSSDKHKRRVIQKHSEYTKWCGKYDDNEFSTSSNEEEPFPPRIDCYPSPTNSISSPQTVKINKSPTPTNRLSCRLVRTKIHKSVPKLCDNASNQGGMPKLQIKRSRSLSFGRAPNHKIAPISAKKQSFVSLTSQMYNMSAPTATMQTLELPRMSSRSSKHSVNSSNLSPQSISTPRKHSIGSPIPEIRNSSFLKIRMTDVLCPQYNQNKVIDVVQSPSYNYNNVVHSPGYNLTQSPQLYLPSSHGYEQCVQHLYGHGKFSNSSENSSGPKCKD